VNFNSDTSRLAQALNDFFDLDYLLEKLAQVLIKASENCTISYAEIKECCHDLSEDVLLLCWKWKLLIPLRTSGCGEWDNLILLAEEGENYQLPNVSRFLVDIARISGHWDSQEAIFRLFRIMNEPAWQMMPELVVKMMAKAVNGKVDALAIREACREVNMEERLDTMIAILKGSGIISPKLASKVQISRIGSPLYEVNPCVFAEMK